MKARIQRNVDALKIKSLDFIQPHSTHLHKSFVALSEILYTSECFSFTLNFSEGSKEVQSY